MNQRMLTRTICFVVLALLVPVTLSAQESPRCSILIAKHKKSSDDTYLLPKGSDAEVNRLTRERACQISYKFREGEERIIEASPEELKADFDRLKLLFDYFDKLPRLEQRVLRTIPKGDAGINRLVAFMGRHPKLATNDVARLLHISKGWDREQVSLYFQFYRMQSLRLNGRDKECAAMFDQMRNGLVIEDHKLDYPEQTTYFSKATLRNLIAIQGFASKASIDGTTLREDGAWIADYLDNRDALSQLMGYSWTTVKGVNLDLFLEAKLRDINRLGLGTADWESDRRLGNVAGSLKDGADTVLFIKGKELHAVRVLADGVRVLNQTEAGTLLKATYKKDLDTRSTRDMTLFNVLKYPDGSFQVDLKNEEITLSPGEFLDLKEGRALPPTHPLTKALTADETSKVMYANSIMQFSGVEQKAADQFAFALQKSYPDVSIYRDPLTEETDRRVKELRHFVVTGPSQVTAIVADESFRPRVDDFNIVRDVKLALSAAGIEVISFKEGQEFQWTKGRGRGLIVITGHSSDGLAQFVRKLGQAGAFEGNYVLFNSCETELTRRLVSEVDTRYKSAATFAHDGIIPASNLRSFLKDFSERLSKVGDKNFGQMLRESLTTNRLNGIWTVSKLQRQGTIEGGGN